MLGKINNYEEIYKEMLSYLDGGYLESISSIAAINLISRGLVRENDIEILGRLLRTAAKDNDIKLIKVILDNHTIDYLDLYDALVFSITNDDKIIDHIDSETVIFQYGKTTGRKHKIKEPKEINLEQIRLILNHEALYEFKLGGEYYEKGQYIRKEHLFIMLEILAYYNYKLPDEVMKLFQEHMEDPIKQPARRRV